MFLSLLNLDVLLVFFMLPISEYDSACHIAFFYFAIGIANKILFIIRDGLIHTKTQNTCMHEKYIFPLVER